MDSVEISEAVETYATGKESPPLDERSSTSFDFLPPELLRQIVDSSISDAFHSSSHLTRQETLSRLSQVCWRLREIAHPRLFEILWIKSSDRKTLNSVLDTYRSPIRRKSIKRLIVSDNWADTLEVDVFKRFLEDCERLESFTVYRWSSDLMVFPNLRVFQNLIELQISGSFEFSSFNSFPFLQSLTLTYKLFSSTIILLNPLSFPSLRNLAIAGFEGPNSIHNPSVYHSFQLVLHELDTLTIDRIWFERDYDSLFSHFQSKILVDCQVSDLPRLDPSLILRVQHLRLLTTNTQSTEAVKKQLGTLASLLHRRTTLRSIYLDVSFSIIDSSPLVARTRNETVSEFFIEWGIEVIYEMQWKDAKTDPQISQEFSRRCREKAIS